MKLSWPKLGLMPKPPAPAVDLEEARRVESDAKAMALFAATPAFGIVAAWAGKEKADLVCAFTSGTGNVNEIRGKLALIRDFTQWMAAWPERGAAAQKAIEAAQGK